MRASFVARVDPRADPLSRHGLALENVQVDAFVFEGPPQTLYHPIVDPAATPVHGEFHLRVVQHVGEVGTGELRSSIEVE